MFTPSNSSIYSESIIYVTYFVGKKLRIFFIILELRNMILPRVGKNKNKPKYSARNDGSLNGGTWLSAPVGNHWPKFSMRTAKTQICAHRKFQPVIPNRSGEPGAPIWKLHFHSKQTVTVGCCGLRVGQLREGCGGGRESSTKSKHDRSTCPINSRWPLEIKQRGWQTTAQPQSNPRISPETAMFLPQNEAAQADMRAAEKARREGYSRIEAWVEEAIPSEIRRGITISVQEVKCSDPNCSPIDTAIAILFPR